jgi:prepilin-type processing-associated H-X9-DG protein
MNLQNDLRPQAQSRGFSQADLSAVVFMGAVIFLVLLPAMAARPGLNAKSFQCLDNIRQMVNAWRMYADDNRDVMLFATTGGGRTGASVPVDTANPSDPNNFAWTGCHLDFEPANRANWDTNYDIVRRPLWLYTSRNAAIYKCPADPSTLNNLAGVLVPRVQSYSMNTYLGGFAPDSGGTGTDGGWTDADAYRIYSKTTDLTAPGPDNTLAFIDMSSPGDNWGDFMIDMTGYLPHDPSLYNLNEGPGYYHDGSGTVSFADGHTEIHRWVDPRTIWTSIPNSVASPNNPDVAWLQDHATRPK